MHHFEQGLSTKQAHKAIPEGHFEEEQGRKGFFGPVSHLIRRNPSTHWVNIDGPLKPHLYDLVELPKRDGMQRLAHNNDISIYNCWASPVAATQLKAQRDSDGDLV